MKTVEELDVFKLSHSLALEIFETTKAFPNPPSSPLKLRGDEGGLQDRGGPYAKVRRTLKCTYL